MKVIVNTFLNVRVGKPSVNAPCYQYLAPGSELEVDGKLYKGDMFEGSNLWYRDKAKNYYWAGGVAKDAPEPQVLSFQNDYAPLLGFLPAAYSGTGGQNSRIAIVDDGIVLNSDFLSQTPTLRNCAQVSGASAHGTFIAGILAGKKKIFGAVPEATLYSIKFKNTVGFNKWFDALDEALDMLAQLPKDKPLVVNISQGVDYSDAQTIPKHKTIADKLRQLVANGAIVIVAAGDDSQLLKGNEQFPAVVPEVLSVGCVSKAFVQSSLASISTSVNVLSPLVDYRSFDTDFNVYSEPGSSFATALMSAMAALVQSGGGNFGQLVPRYAVLPKDFNYTLNNRFQYTIINPQL